MDSALVQMQARLEEHFKKLTVMRESTGFPVFALEHGLNEEERDQIRSMLPLRRPSRFWLLWVVHAAEVGYSYAGDEYWSSFKEQTRAWDYHDRPKIKVWFRKFAAAYGGVEPSGPWAEHFSIIAWPITHAILPLYLQHQFAKLLYDLRYQLASQVVPSARSIGRLLANWGARVDSSKRFQVFLEQEELTGQMVLALLGESSARDAPIHPPTLERIVADLEKARDAREWLKDTRHSVSDRFKGIGQGSPPAEGHPDEITPHNPRVKALGPTIRPSLHLRHVEDGKWSAFLLVKSFRQIAALNADIRSFLSETRCRLNGAPDFDFKPGGWLLSGDRIGTLRSWPDPASPLVAFYPANPIGNHLAESVLNHLVESECRLRSGPTWLFRIGTDWIARHIEGQIVRPGCRYIVVSETPIPSDVDCVVQCNLNCESVDAYRLEMPANVSETLTSRLAEMGLQVARTIHVWPAGLPGRSWDGEGSSEWLTTEAPCFGIAADHPVESFAFRLDDDPEVLIPTNGDETLFVRLPQLKAGIHELTVNARRSTGLECIAETPPAEGFVRLVVRNPEPWTPGVASHPGLIVNTDPTHADLDTFWQNRLKLSVNGPESFAASFCVTLQSADGKEILKEQIGTPMNLPITRYAWRTRFADFLKDESRAWKYLEAASCTLAIRADTLGTCTLRFEHEPKPLRWVARSRDSGIAVRLLDDSGRDETDLKACRYSMLRPFETVQITPEDARSGESVEPPGGLFVAINGKYTDTVLISTVSANSGLQELGVTPECPRPKRSALSLCEFCRHLAQWRDARPAGFLPEIRRQEVLESANVAIGVLCGERWERAERQYSEHQGMPSSLESLAGLVDSLPSVRLSLLRLPLPNGKESQTLNWFADEADRIRICSDRVLSKFAFRFAREPLSVVDDPNLLTLLEKLIVNPAVLRASRWLTFQFAAARNATGKNPSGGNLS